MVLEIPRLNVIITFGITGFSITLPTQNFGQNTQGHCGKSFSLCYHIRKSLVFGQIVVLTFFVTHLSGTCDNNQANDCMLPGGQLIESCAVMADFWLAKDIYQPSCELPSVLPTKVPPPPPDIIPCKPDSMCDLLQSR